MLTLEDFVSDYATAKKTIENKVDLYSYCMLHINSFYSHIKQDCVKKLNELKEEQ